MYREEFGRILPGAMQVDRKYDFIGEGCGIGTALQPYFLWGAWDARSRG